MQNFDADMLHSRHDLIFQSRIYVIGELYKFVIGKQVKNWARCNLILSKEPDSEGINVKVTTITWMLRMIVLLLFRWSVCGNRGGFEARSWVSRQGLTSPVPAFSVWEHLPEVAGGLRRSSEIWFIDNVRTHSIHSKYIWYLHHD